MSRSILRSLLFCIILAGLVQCHTPYQAQSVQYIDYRISQERRSDSGLIRLMRPYGDCVNKSMNDLIAVSDIAQEKKQPEGIKQIRAEGGQVLLLDAGDIFQGTPCFNLYKGEPGIKAMTAIGYDAATMSLARDWGISPPNSITPIGSFA
ncbi:MAG: hypothetical protein IPP31_06775 [Chitinophagaceae bacterium]|nr:hypothetical protein [Chitinophagaceae bacterium]